MSKNKMIIYKDYAEVILENNRHEECARVKISIEVIPVAEAYRWSYKKRSGASSKVNGKHSGIHRCILEAKEDEWVCWQNKDILYNVGVMEYKGVMI